MNLSATPAETAAPPAAAQPVPARSRAWRAGIAFAVLAGGLVALVAHIAGPEMTPEEQRLVGHWYGLHQGSGGEGYAWLSEERADRTSRTMFRHFAEKADHSGVNLIYDGVEVGRWSCREGVATFATVDEDYQMSLAGRVLALLEHRVWPPEHSSVTSYRVVELARDDFQYVALTDGEAYHAIRVPADFQMPEHPRPVAEVRAQLAAQRTATREGGEP